MASQTTFSLIITNVDSPLFAGEVVSVTIPATEGVMTILAHHEPTVSLLKVGQIVVRTDTNTEENFQIEGGVVETSNNQVTILV